MAEKPKLNSQGNKELDKVQEQFDSFSESVKEAQLNVNAAPVVETEQQTKISNREAQAANAPFLKPERNFPCKMAFNEKFRARWEHDKEYVRAIAENNEIIGEAVEVWTKPYAGVPYEFWRVPVNKPVMIPRHLANQLASRMYHRFVMEDKPVSQGGEGTYYGAMAVKETRHRLDCRPVKNMSTVAF
jgi:hypothetical protein